jgi:metal-dependent amidase/aminoacylase/carboxypeptidase family protein
VLAVAIKELSSWKIKRNYTLCGTPAEDPAGRVYMARAGLFNDICLDWHPDYENKANMQSSQAIADYTITFKGKVPCSS